MCDGILFRSRKGMKWSASWRAIHSWLILNRTNSMNWFRNSPNRPQHWKLSCNRCHGSQFRYRFTPAPPPPPPWLIYISIDWCFVSSAGLVTSVIGGEIIRQKQSAWISFHLISWFVTDSLKVLISSLDSSDIYFYIFINFFCDIYCIS